MLASIPLTLFNEWADYSELEPFGEERADLRAAIGSCVMANAWRGKGGREFKPQDFMPQFGKTAKPQQTPEQMQHLFATYAQRHNDALKARRGRG